MTFERHGRLCCPLLPFALLATNCTTVERGKLYSRSRAMRSHVGRTTPAVAVAVAWSFRTLRQSLFWILPVLLLLLLGSKSVHGNANTQSEIRCVTVWGNGDGDRMVLLPSDKVNDEYCDCLDSGADEPQTSACSGIFQWAGLFASTTNDIQRKHT
jgi:hypothetical protein